MRKNSFLGVKGFFGEQSYSKGKKKLRLVAMFRPRRPTRPQRGRSGATISIEGWTGGLTGKREGIRQGKKVSGTQVLDERDAKWLEEKSALAKKGEEPLRSTEKGANPMRKDPKRGEEGHPFLLLIGDLYHGGSRVSKPWGGGGGLQVGKYRQEKICPHIASHFGKKEEGDVTKHLRGGWPLDLGKEKGWHRESATLQASGCNEREAATITDYGKPAGPPEEEKEKREIGPEERNSRLYFREKKEPIFLWEPRTANRKGGQEKKTGERTSGRQGGG